jgi:hypothetical protein
MATSSTYNITATQGNTLLLNLTANDSAGNPINLSGYLVRGVVKYKYSDTGHLLNLNPTITSYVSGKVNLSGDAGELSVMPVGVFVYDLEAAQVSGSYVTKFLRGYFNIGPETTT